MSNPIINKLNDVTYRKGVIDIEEITRTCTKCGFEKVFELFPKCKNSLNGRKRYCWDCGKLMKQAFKDNNPVEYKIRRCAESLIRRTGIGIDEPGNRSYKVKGIKCLIGENSGDVYRYLYDKHYSDFKYFIDNGITPSIDRIDSNKHYEEGNIRIIPFEENSRLGRESSLKVCSKPIKITYKNTNESFIYFSVSEAGKQSEFSRDVLQNILKNRVKKDHGIVVEYI